MFSKFLSVTSLILLLVSLVGLSGCSDEPPEIEKKITKALKKFDTDEQNEAHEREMRKYHMDHLKHKRDETMYKGIRTAEDSLIGCINCHVPAPTADKVVRHTDPEHFCATCHTYAAVDIDCFQCHADHPDKADVAPAPKPVAKPSSEDTPSTAVKPADKAEAVPAPAVEAADKSTSESKSSTEATAQ